MVAVTAVAIVLVVVVVTIHKCKKRLQGIADFMSECILLLLTLTLQSNSNLVFSEKFRKVPRYKQVYLHIKQLQSFCCALERMYVTFSFSQTFI